MKLSKLKAPNTYFIISAVIVLVAVLTWIIPGGKYQTTVIDGREVVLAESFEYVAKNPQGIGDVLMAPIRGFVNAALIIGFVLIVGGSFAIFQQTRAVDAAIMAIVKAHKTSRILRILLIPIIMILFSLAGATFGMSEQVIPEVVHVAHLAPVGRRGKLGLRLVLCHGLTPVSIDATRPSSLTRPSASAARASG